MSATLTHSDLLDLAHVKFGLLAHGAVVESAADAAMHDAKRPIRTRSGVSGGLDIRLAEGIDVNVPVVDPFAQESPYALSYADGQFRVMCETEVLSSYEPVPTPAYYDTRTADDTEWMHRIGQMCSADRFCYGMTGPTCYFWARSRRCQYCTIGRNFSADAVRKQSNHMLEVLRAAVEDKALPARHVLIGGGTPPGEDMGAMMAAELCEQVKDSFPDLSIYVMIAAPLDNRHLDRLHKAGADEVGLNLEFWSKSAWKTFIPGKHTLIGKERYLEALAHCVELFGPINTRSILIAGLEPLDHTFEAAISLAELGVMPIISPFRPLHDAVLADRRGPSASEYVELWESVDRALKPLGMPLGPTCIACQNNTLALPSDDRYRSY